MIRSTFFWGCGMGFLLALAGCSGSGRLSESDVRSDYYTRGIGVYPGDPQEDFSPELLPDSSGFRNVARMRAVTQSSAYDYNLTAQLLTDGVISTEQPPYLVVSTPEGDLPKREREWMIDGGPYSKNTVDGEDTYFQFALKNYGMAIEKVTVKGSVAYDEKVATEGYAWMWEASADGKNWVTLAERKGRGLPGTQAGKVKVTDPNKQTETIALPTRKLEETFDLAGGGRAFAYYRTRMQMKGARVWTFNEVQTDHEMKPSDRFCSAWMSATAGTEWVCVDLGISSEVDSVRLHWINKAVKGRVQVSDSGKDWDNLAELPGGSAQTDVLAVNAKARYVRILMEESADGGRYILSEVEVLGRGGLSPRPVDMPSAEEGKLVLSGGNWFVQRASEVTEGGETLSSVEYKPAQWVVATVPGTVQTSYRNAGALPDINYADNQLTVSESFFNSNFWYRNEFELPQGFKRECVMLNFDGINWKAHVYLNGQKVGDIEGAFIRGAFDVTRLLQEGTNVLAVEIVKNEHIGAVKEKNRQNADFNGGILGADNPTFHATIGWDWIPTMRGRNIGIWNDVTLTSTGPVTVCDPFVQTALTLPDTTQARLTPEVIVKNHADVAVEGVLEGKVGPVTFEQSVRLAAGEERTVTFSPDNYPQLLLKNPRLWWPNGYGEPYLYEAGFTFKIEGKVSDRKNFKVGVRQMDFTEEGRALNLYVNGRRFIGMGGNWGFSESNLNYRGREYETAVAYHADMNFTMLRNWVGMTGDEELYDACDRHGIMIWQDFWLANPADGPDPYNPDMFIANAEDYVRRIRSHASIGLYCGRNEGYPPRQIDEALRRIVKEEHPGLHYIPSSCHEVVSGHGPYRMLPVKEYFTLKNGARTFHSERGMPNVMTFESLQRTFSPEGLWPQSGEWGMHDYTLESAQRASTFNAIIAKGYGEPKDVREFAGLAQWVNYDGHRAMFESRSAHRMGLLMWMSHPCWPSMVWQTYDYYFEPTAAYFGIKKACEPLHIQWNAATDEVEVVNYHARHRAGLKAVAQVLNMDGSVAWEKEAEVDSREDTTVKCFKLEYPDGLSDVHFIKLVLKEGDRVVSENFYHRGKEEGNYQALKQLPRVSLQEDMECRQTPEGEWLAVVTLENDSRTPALMIRLNIVGKNDGLQFLPVFYSDNYFALLPGEKKTVEVRWKDVDTRGNRPKLEVTGYNVD